MSKYTRLVGVAVRGFGVFRDSANLRLDTPGITLLSGRNHDSLAADSNGSGKSTLLRAVCHGLYGHTVDHLTARQLVNRRATTSEVQVMFDVDGASYVVCRRCTASGKTSTSLRLATGEDLTGATQLDTQNRIDNLLGMAWETFRCCVMFGQGDYARFASPFLTDAVRKDILRTVLDLGIYDALRDAAREQVKGLKGLLAGNAEALRDLEAHVRRAEAALVREGAMLDALHTLDDTAETRRRTMAKDLAEATTHRALAVVEVEHAAAAVNEATESRDDEDAVLTVVREELRENGRRREAVAQRLALLRETGACPHCGQDRAPCPAEEAEAEAEAERLAARRAKLAALEDKRERRYRAHKIRVAECRGVLDSATATQRLAEAQMQSLAEELRKVEADVSTYAHDIAERERAVLKLRAEHLELGAQLRALAASAQAWTKEQAVASWFASTGFSGRGVPAFAIEAVLPALNVHTNAHLAELTDGDITVSWTATTTSTSGTALEVLTCVVSVEGVEGAIPSGGQMRKVELATELALAELATAAGRSTFNVLFFDEALDGLDAEGRRRVVDWLPTLGAATVFVVSHDEEIAEAFDTVVTVVKSGGSATLLTA